MRFSPALLLVLVACGDAPDHAAHDGHDADHAPAAAHDGDHDAKADAHGDDHAAHAAPAAAAGPGGLALVLDDGKKWTLDDPTRASAARLRGLVEAAGADDQALTDAAAIGGLAAALKAELDTMISGCTMQGPAHDQLHRFLSAFMPAVDALAAETDPAVARQRLADLRTMLIRFDAHFA